MIPPVANSKSIKNPAIKAGLAHLKQLLKQDWAPLFESKGVVATKTQAAGTKDGIPVTKGEVMVPAELFPFAIFNLCLQSDSRVLFDDRTESAKHVETDPKEGVSLVYAVQKGVWPVSARELVIVNSPLMYDDELKCFLVVQKSVKDDRFPVNSNGRVTAELHVNALMLSQTSAGWKATYIVHADPMGTIPAALASVVTNANPMIPRRMIDFLLKTGCPPGLHGVIPVAVDQNSAKTKILQVAYAPSKTMSGEFVAPIVVDKKYYPTGAMVKVSDGVKVVRSKIGIKISFDTKALKEISVRIAPLDGGKPGDIVLNGTAI